MSPTHGSRHLDARAGSVLTPHDYITNVQKRLGNREWTGFGQCRMCGSFLDPQRKHGETCSTVQATRGHYACVHAVSGGLKLADPCITTEPRGHTETQLRPADIFTTAAVPGRSTALDVCVWPLPMQQRLEVTQRRQLLIVNCPITAMKSQTYVTRAFTIVPIYGQQLGDDTLPSLEHCSLQQMSHPAAMANTSAQMETRNSDSPPSPESSHDASSPTEPFSTSRVAPRRHRTQSRQSLVPSSPS